jgi:NADH dehydrogenase
VLKGCEVVKGTVTGVDVARRVVTVRLRSQEVVEYPYDHLVLAPGSVARTLPIPGLAEQGIGLQAGRGGDLPPQPRDRPARRRGDHRRRRDPPAAMTFVFVGGGYAASRRWPRPRT